MPLAAATIDSVPAKSRHRAACAPRAARGGGRVGPRSGVLGSARRAAGAGPPCALPGLVPTSPEPPPEPAERRRTWGVSAAASASRCPGRSGMPTTTPPAPRAAASATMSRHSSDAGAPPLRTTRSGAARPSSAAARPVHTVPRSTPSARAGTGAARAAPVGAGGAPGGPSGPCRCCCCCCCCCCCRRCCCDKPPSTGRGAGGASHSGRFSSAEVGGGRQRRRRRRRTAGSAGEARRPRRQLQVDRQGCLTIH
jgi:hypothetical protein